MKVVVGMIEPRTNASEGEANSGETDSNYVSLAKTKLSTRTMRSCGHDVRRIAG